MKKLRESLATTQQELADAMLQMSEKGKSSSMVLAVQKATFGAPQPPTNALGPVLSLHGAALFLLISSGEETRV